MKIVVIGDSNSSGFEMLPPGFKMYENCVIKPPIPHLIRHNYERLHAWPSILGKLLDLEVINLAVEGYSNDSICRVFNVFINNNATFINNERILLIVGFTIISRTEFWDENADGWKSININSHIIDDEILDFYYTKMYSDKFGCYNYYSNVLNISTLCKLHNINFIFFNIFDSSTNLKYSTNDLNMENLIDPNWFVSEGLIPYLEEKEAPRGIMAHFLEEGHQLWAEYMYKEIMNRNIIHD